MEPEDSTLAAVGRFGWRVSRFFAGVLFVALTIFAVVGFISQQQAATRLAAEVATRRDALEVARREQATLTAEVAALNDPVRYAQYATLVGRHTLLLARPDETLVLVTWTNADGTPLAGRTADWKLILHAAGIPTT